MTPVVACDWAYTNGAEIADAASPDAPETGVAGELVDEAAGEEPAAEPGPRKRGWWQRRLSAE